MAGTEPGHDDAVSHHQTHWDNVPGELARRRYQPIRSRCLAWCVV